MAAVSSVDASSPTTISQSVNVCARTDAIVSAIVDALL